MAIPVIVGTIATMIIEGITNYFQRNQEIKKVEHEAEIVRIRTEAEQAGKLDELSMGQRSWKDEYLLLITTAPLVLLFFSPLLDVSSVDEIQYAIRTGFSALEETPEYYWYALALIYVDTFGFRQMMRTGFQAWLNKKFGVS
jgi:hypothetical protein